MAAEGRVELQDTLSRGELATQVLWTVRHMVVTLQEEVMEVVREGLAHLQGEEVEAVVVTGFPRWSYWWRW